jgi:PadR family transcriptional regulator, regulatory protein PadR
MLGGRMALLRGTLDILILKALSWVPMHGAEITAWLEERTSGEVVIVDAALLQSLHRMEERKLVAAEWGVTEKARRARFYRLTPAGRATLRAESNALVHHMGALTAALTAKTLEP